MRVVRTLGVLVVGMRPQGEFQFVTGDHEFDALHQEWDELATARSAGPFLMPDVVAAWRRHMGRGRTAVFVWRRSGRIVGLVPLDVRGVGPMRFGRWVGHGFGVVGEILCADDELAAPLLAALAERIWFLELKDCADDGPAVAALRASQAVRAIRESDMCPIIDVGQFANMKELLGRPKARKLRQNLARAERAAAAAPDEVRFDRFTSRKDMSSVIADAAHVAMAAEQERGLGNAFSGPTGQFVADALDRLALSGRAFVVLARIGDRPVGVHVALRSGATAIAWLARVDPAAAPYSVGHLMLRTVCEWSIDQSLDRVDLQLGGDAYKQRWATGSYKTVDVVVSPLRIGRAAPTLLRTIERTHGVRSTVRNVTETVRQRLALIATH